MATHFSSYCLFPSPVRNKGQLFFSSYCLFPSPVRNKGTAIFLQLLALSLSIRHTLVRNKLPLSFSIRHSLVRDTGTAIFLQLLPFPSISDILQSGIKGQLYFYSYWLFPSPSDILQSGTQGQLYLSSFGCCPLHLTYSSQGHRYSYITLANTTSTQHSPARTQGRSN